MLDCTSPPVSWLQEFSAELYFAFWQVCLYVNTYFTLWELTAAGKKLLSCQVRSARVSSEQSCWAQSVTAGHSIFPSIILQVTGTIQISAWLLSLCLLFWPVICNLACCFASELCCWVSCELCSRGLLHQHHPSSWLGPRGEESGCRLVCWGT